MARLRIGARAAICLALLAGAPAAARSEPSYGSEVPPAGVIAQLDRLAAQRPGTVDLYGILVGGDGSEDVFRKEVADVRRVLEDRFDAAGRTVTLVNSRASPEPEATLHSLAYALKRVAATMDRNEDVLFLHLTTHGGSNHVLVLQHPERELYGLSPQYLKALLDQAGIRYRVVVVSACYSGAFVAPLAGANALVITAASSNRQSFGCGNDSRITEFSRALYLKALQQTRSLPAAARTATQIVHELERASGRKHSYPQMRLGVAIEDRLRSLEQRLGDGKR
jgi:peptidase C13-like protein